jgi:hypothetical protein
LPLEAAVQNHRLILLANFQIKQTVAGELKIHKSVDEGSNYYLDKFLAPKKLGLKVGCFTENIYFNHSPVTIYKITGKISHNNIREVTMETSPVVGSLTNLF